MYAVSEQYKEQIQQQIRNPSFVRVTFGIIDPQAKDGAIILDDSSAPYSDSSFVKNETVIETRYDTLEHNQFILDNNSKHILGGASYGLYQGYVSGSVSDSDGYFLTPPVLSVTYDTTYDLAGVSLNFDEVRGDYCSEVRIVAYLSGAKVHDVTYDNLSIFFTSTQGVPNHDLLEVHFLRTSLPYKRVKLSYIGFGITKIYDDSVLINTEQNRKVDILSTVLPVGDFSFTFLDTSNEYNPENPVGLYQYLEELQPVRFEYGYELNDGTTEWILGGNNYTTGEVQFDSGNAIPKVTIKTNNALAYLDDIYFKGSYNPTGRTLYNLALDVLDGTGVSYDIDNSLNDITSFAPLPKDTVRNCLQLIANASMCTLDVSRTGAVQIKKAYSLEELIDSLDSPIIDVLDSQLFVLGQNGQTDFKFDKSNYYKSPKVDRIPPLKNVITSYRTFTPKTTSENLATVDVVSANQTQFFFDYDLAKDVVLSAGTGLTVNVAPVYYAYGCLVTLTGTGAVTITGKKIDVAENTITQNYNLTGNDCVVSNELITNSLLAKNYALWVGGVLTLKNEYNFENRGFPELDPMDKLYLETLYTPNQKVILTENKIVYSGALKGTSKMIIAE